MIASARGRLASRRIAVRRGDVALRRFRWRRRRIFMLERSISYDAAIQLIRRRLQGDRSPDRALEVLIMEALASGEVPMEPVFVPFAAKRYGYDSLVACKLWLRP